MTDDADQPVAAQHEEPEARVVSVGTEVRAFLIADIRSYTRFTQEHGDEAAGRLAESFAGIMRQGVTAHGGQLTELRGDEALAVFSSARQALRAAVNLQDRFAEHTETHPDEPLGVGIGLDAGEAVAAAGGYRGGALNLAARLCSSAGPGQILASEAITHLAQKMPGISYRLRGAKRLKGMTDAVRIVQVVGDHQVDVEKAPTFDSHSWSPTTTREIGSSPIPPIPASFEELGERIQHAVFSKLEEKLGPEVANLAATESARFRTERKPVVLPQPPSVQVAQAPRPREVAPRGRPRRVARESRGRGFGWPLAIAFLLVIVIVLLFLHFHGW